MQLINSRADTKKKESEKGNDILMRENGAFV